MTYTFTTDEESEARNLIDAANYYCVLFELDQYLRAKIKHSDGDVSNYEDAREALRDMMNNYNLIFDR
jgi:hypothetical protein